MEDDVDIENLIMLPKIISDSNNLADEFRELFSLSEAKQHKGVVYFFFSVQPIPRLHGASNILYIGKTKQSISGRYLRYSDDLASGANGDIYKYIINKYGGLELGYILTDNPRESEKQMFQKYRDTYWENPPKSKVG